MHFREAKLLQSKSIIERAELDKAIDFMDTIEEDIPRGNEYLYLICFLVV